MNSSVMLWRLLEREADWLPPDIRSGRFVSGAGVDKFLEGDRQSSGDAETQVGQCQAGHVPRRFGSVNEGIDLHHGQHYQ